MSCSYMDVCFKRQRRKCIGGRKMKVYDIDIKRLRFIVASYHCGIPKEQNVYLLSKGVAFRVVTDDANVGKGVA